MGVSPRQSLLHVLGYDLCRARPEDCSMLKVGVILVCVRVDRFRTKVRCWGKPEEGLYVEC